MMQRSSNVFCGKIMKEKARKFTLRFVKYSILSNSSGNGFNNMDYLVKYSGAKGHIPVVWRGDGGLQLISFDLLLFDPGMVYREETADEEVCIVLLGGRATVEVEGAVFEHIGKREDVFGGLRFFLFAPRPGLSRPRYCAHARRSAPRPLTSRRKWLLLRNAAATTGPATCTTFSTRALPQATCSLEKPSARPATGRARPRTATTLKTRRAKPTMRKFTSSR